jgi:hypothetical protein
LNVRQKKHPMTPALKVYVRLKDEGTNCWRPVEVAKKSDGVFQIMSAQPKEEVWEFPSGAKVRCQKKKLQDGEALVAYERVE